MFEFKWLGLTDYKDALDLQEKLKKQVLRTSQGIILGLEHPKIISQGIRGRSSDIIKREAPVIRTQRGGQTTIHNPGQLIIYPILPYKLWKIKPIQLVNLLLSCTEAFLRECNIIIVNNNKGLFTSSGKITSIGLNIKGGISTHGLAINISNNLDDFKIIEACGIQACKMDSVLNNKIQIPTEVAFTKWLNCFQTELFSFIDKQSKSLTL